MVGTAGIELVVLFDPRGGSTGKSSGGRVMDEVCVDGIGWV